MQQPSDSIPDKHTTGLMAQNLLDAFAAAEEQPAEPTHDLQPITTTVVQQSSYSVPENHATGLTAQNLLDAFAATEEHLFEPMRDLHPMLRRMIYEYTLRANIKQKNLKLTIPSDFETETDGNILRSRFNGFAFLAATANSTEWTEDREVATKVAWSAIVLNFSIVNNRRLRRDYQFFDRLMSKIVELNPVEHIKGLRCSELTGLVYLVLDRYLLPSKDGQRGVRPCPRAWLDEMRWRKFLPGVQTIEVFCNHPMLPSSHDESRVLRVLTFTIEPGPYVNRMLLTQQDVATSLCVNLPNLKHIILKNPRRSYVLGFEKTKDELVSFKLDRVQNA